jgi:hypothetical protein
MIKYTHHNMMHATEGRRRALWLVQKKIHARLSGMPDFHRLRNYIRVRRLHETAPRLPLKMRANVVMKKGEPTIQCECNKAAKRVRVNKTGRSFYLFMLYLQVIQMGCFINLINCSTGAGGSACFQTPWHSRDYYHRSDRRTQLSY